MIKTRVSLHMSQVAHQARAYPGFHSMKRLGIFLLHGGLMVSALDSGASAPGSSPGLGHCVVFLGKTLYSHGASLHPGV